MAETCAAHGINHPFNRLRALTRVYSCLASQFFGTEVIGPEPLEPLPLDRSILGLQEAARLEAAAAEEVGSGPAPTLKLKLPGSSGKKTPPGGGAKLAADNSL